MTQKPFSVSRLKIGNYEFPLFDTSQSSILIDDGTGMLTFGLLISTSGDITVSGSGIVGTMVRWVDSNSIEASPVYVDNSNNVSSVANITTTGITRLSGLRYPSGVSLSGSMVTTNGSGILILSLPTDGVDGSGTNLTLARWTSIDTINIVGAGTLDNSGILQNFDNIACVNTISAGGDISNALNSTSLISSGSSITLSGNGLTCISCDGCRDASIDVGSNCCSFICSISSTFTAGDTKASFIASENIYQGDTSSGFVACLASIGISLEQNRDGFIGGSTDVVVNNTLNSNSVASKNVSLGGPQTDNCSVIASLNCTIDGSQQYTSTILASSNCDMSGSGNIAGVPAGAGASQYCTIMASLSGQLSGIKTNCAQLGCTMVKMDTSLTVQGVCLASNDMTSNNSNAVVGGTSGARNWLIDSTTGSYYGQVLTVQTPVPDFAEYFENDVSGLLLPFGSLVTFSNKGLVKLASGGDKVFGIVSSNPAITAGGADLFWNSTFLYNKWGQLITITNSAGVLEQVINPDYISNDQFIINASNIVVPNPDFNPSFKYKSRKERPLEWTCVGLIGQLRTRVDSNVTEGCYITCSDTPGMGTKSDVPTKMKCMKMLYDFSDNPGYGISLTLIK